MNKPFFSVIIPTYNRPDSLLKMLGYIGNQKFEQFEIIIVDDSSTDNTKIVAQVGDPRIQYFYRGKRLGVSSARNFGAQHATGNYFAFIDDDDKVTNNWLQDFYNLLNGSNYPELAYCAMARIDKSEHVNRTIYPADGKFFELVIPGAFILSKELFSKVGGYDKRFNFGENTELFFRINALNPQRVFTNAVNFYYKQSIAGLSQHLENKIEANKLYLIKHADMFKLDKRKKMLCLSIIAVSYLRLGKFKDAREYILCCILEQPLNLKHVSRLLISYLPYVSKFVYK
jgi:glycosyltransferase involved in cell wall biosynthesis